ncbi:unnamed protein product [Rotaria magnacalcarata]|uniref:Uncharacterized protein n=1 Tax=Rotaria magnacalcarata TaxID=392030 RepID=A0A816Q4M5_9BILA|nr:unnamed protein product [Rotaria magnacalcarata]
MKFAEVHQPGTFNINNHFYPEALNKSLCPEVKSFLELGNERIAERYCYLHPEANYKRLCTLMSSKPSVFHWSGSDLLHVTDHSKQKQMILLETNSCPSGQKSMPTDSYADGNSGYHKFVRLTFLTAIKAAEQSNKMIENGHLAVIYDKNPMENRGYAAAMADIFDEATYSIEFHHSDLDPPVKFINQVMFVRDSSSNWISIRAAFRYITHTPWLCIPVQSKTIIINPIIACLAGGRNKNLADRAYQILNKENEPFGLRIRTPHTVRNVRKSDVQHLNESLGGHMVVKVPYSNAGQGVFIITNKRDLEKFMETPDYYEKYIIQSLVGSSKWIHQNDVADKKDYYHVGTRPNNRKEVFVMDLRIQVCGTDIGFQPLAIFGRRAALPLRDQLSDNDNSWAMLGTNLSHKKDHGQWATDTERLLVLDSNGWNQLGLTMDDLIDGYVQAILAHTAIDRLAQQLIKCNGGLDLTMFRELNNDAVLINEILI